MQSGEGRIPKAQQEKTGRHCRRDAIPEYSDRPFRLAWLLRTYLRLLAVVFCSAAVMLAQQPGAGPPDAPSAAKTGNSSRRRNPPAALVTTLEKKSIVFPDIATSPGPLSPGEKFKLFVDDSASLHALAESALGAGISQATDSPEGYGQGGEGYGKRFGSSLARNASSGFFGTFVLASVLHQDPRFFPEQNPTFASSVKYSLSRLVITREDQGNEVANWSGLFGPLLAEALANAYWPERDRTAAQTFQRYGLDLATRAGGNMFRNYWPVFFKKLRRSSSSQANGRN